jgi:phosphodiesterase/alkaline phosphatase D-like protein
MHHAVITGLKPRTRYYYRVGDKDTGLSEAFSFVTAPALPEPFKIAIYGDMGVHDSKETMAGVRRLVESNAIDWIFHIGDIRYAASRSLPMDDCTCTLS